MHKFAALFLMLWFAGANAQTTKKFYDSEWQEVQPEKAMYYAEFTKAPTGYKCISYWRSSNKKREESFYADTSMSKPNGLHKVYHKNGAIEDSILFSNEGKLLESFHYYANRQLECHYMATADGGAVKEAYDEGGSRIKNYVFARAAAPPGGAGNWVKFLQKKTAKDMYSHTPESITATLVIRFVVDEDGNVVKPKLIESSGIRAVDQDALQVVMASPPWKPAIYKNKPFRTVQTQPFTYELKAQKKS